MDFCNCAEHGDLRGQVAVFGTGRQVHALGDAESPCTIAERARPERL
ncbi:hypothetical protein [Nocardioides alcanivorans]|nr:hypothetical protein [Nocardioides alcanivorans]